MSAVAQNRTRAILLPLGLLILSLAVFGWGLQYKLSLYQSKNSITHLAPEAKLLSQKERSAAVQASSQLSELPMWPVVAMLASIFAPCLAVHRFYQARPRDAEPPHLPACIRRIFVRPPPALSLSL